MSKLTRVLIGITSVFAFLLLNYKLVGLISFQNGDRDYLAIPIVLSVVALVYIIYKL